MRIVDACWTLLYCHQNCKTRWAMRRHLTANGGQLMPASDLSDPNRIGAQSFQLSSVTGGCKLASITL